ncbi:hypothetical protein TSMEX_007083 [Taenia solium]|eukprot:TsM_000957700 transcript=TsM_000957700 gene=TsM_000957700
MLGNAPPVLEFQHVMSGKRLESSNPTKACCAIDKVLHNPFLNNVFSIDQWNDELLDDSGNGLRLFWEDKFNGITPCNTDEIAFMRLHGAPPPPIDLFRQHYTDGVTVPANNNDQSRSLPRAVLHFELAGLLLLVLLYDFVRTIQFVATTCLPLRFLLVSCFLFILHFRRLNSQLLVSSDPWTATPSSITVGFELTRNSRHACSSRRHSDAASLHIHIFNIFHWR